MHLIRFWSQIESKPLCFTITIPYRAAKAKAADKQKILEEEEERKKQAKEAERARKEAEKADRARKEAEEAAAASAAAATAAAEASKAAEAAEAERARKEADEEAGKRNISIFDYLQINSHNLNINRTQKNCGRRRSPYSRRIGTRTTRCRRGRTSQSSRTRKTKGIGGG